MPYKPWRVIFSHNFHCDTKKESEEIEHKFWSALYEDFVGQESSFNKKWWLVHNNLKWLRNDMKPVYTFSVQITFYERELYSKFKGNLLKKGLIKKLHLY